MAKDFLGRELNVGDPVVFMQVKYRNLMRGTIVKLNEKKAVIEHEKTNLGDTKTLQFYEQIVKIVD